MFSRTILIRREAWLTNFLFRLNAIQQIIRISSIQFCFGGYSGGDTPLPIPNRVVKLTSADDTVSFGNGKVGRRQSIFLIGNQLYVDSLFYPKMHCFFLKNVLDKLRLKYYLSRPFDETSSGS